MISTYINWPYDPDESFIAEASEILGRKIVEIEAAVDEADRDRVIYGVSIKGRMNRLNPDSFIGRNDAGLLKIHDMEAILSASKENAFDQYENTELDPSNPLMMAFEKEPNYKKPPYFDKSSILEVRDEDLGWKSLVTEMCIRLFEQAMDDRWNPK